MGLTPSFPAALALAVVFLLPACGRKSPEPPGQVPPAVKDSPVSSQSAAEPKAGAGLAAAVEAPETMLSDDDGISGYSEPFFGDYEYRQAAGEGGFDEEGEILELTNGIRGEADGRYFGLEREGEHGLFYTLARIKGIKFGDRGSIVFFVPERKLFSTRPKNLEEVESGKLESTGFSRDTLFMKGRLTENVRVLALACSSAALSCPEDTLRFWKGRQGPWSSPE